MNIFQHIDKKVVAVFGFLIVLLLGSFFFWLAGRKKETGPITTLPVSTLNATLGRELLAALADLKSTKLDVSIFEDPILASLKDFGVEIASQPVGRRNPFASFLSTAPAVSKTGGSTKTPALPAGKSKTNSTPAAPSDSGLDGFDGFDLDQ